MVIIVPNGSKVHKWSVYAKHTCTGEIISLHNGSAHLETALLPLALPPPHHSGSKRSTLPLILLVLSKQVLVYCDIIFKLHTFVDKRQSSSAVKIPAQGLLIPKVH